MCIQYKIQVRSQKKLKVHNKWKKKSLKITFTSLMLLSNMTNSQNYTEITNTLLLH